MLHLVETLNKNGLQPSIGKFHVKLGIVTDFPTDKTKLMVKLGFDAAIDYPFNEETARVFENRLTSNLCAKMFRITRKRTDDGTRSENSKRLDQTRRERSRGRGGGGRGGYQNNNTRMYWPIR